MNKTLLLLLVTIVQSQSDGILLSTNPIHTGTYDDSPDDFVVEDWEEFDAPYSQIREDFGDVKVSNVRKRSAVDPLMRRSALDKNFMRFGRSGFFPEQAGAKLKRFSSDLPENDNVVLFGRSPGNNFMRFGRSSKDNFIRFGRGQKDNFIRFGRGTKDNFIRFGRGTKDNFMRFGRGAKENFMRFGKSNKDNFIRFGRSDKNFMRFGRENPEDADYYSDVDDNEYFSRLAKDKNFLRFGKRPKASNSFVRFGKSTGKSDNFIRFGKSVRNNGTNFLRFGRDGFEPNKEPFEVTEDNNPDVDLGDLDLNGDKLKNGPIIRIKRNIDDDDYINETPNRWWELENSADPTLDDKLNRVGRDAEIMEEIPRLRKNDSNPLDEGDSQQANARSADSLSRMAKLEKKRSIEPVLLSDVIKNLPNIDDQSSSPLRMYAPLSSGFSSFVLSPEFSLLPQVQKSKRNQVGTNFIRLG